MVADACGFVPVNVALDQSVDWNGATVGDFDPGRMWEQRYGEHVDAGTLRAVCLEAFGPPTPAGERMWRSTDYVLSTPREGVFLEVRLDADPSRRFGYILDPELGDAIRRERRALGRRGEEVDNQRLPPSSPSRRSEDALQATMACLAHALGLEVGMPPAAQRTHASSPMLQRV